VEPPVPINTSGFRLVMLGGELSKGRIVETIRRREDHNPDEREAQQSCGGIEVPEHRFRFPCSYTHQEHIM
jgi:hypothetical protein